MDIEKCDLEGLIRQIEQLQLQDSDLLQELQEAVGQRLVLEQVEQTTQAECGICQEKHNAQDLLWQDVCGHSLCKECATSYVTSEIRDSRVQIACPTCKAQSTEANCNQTFLSDTTIRNCLSTEHVEKYERLQVALATSGDSRLFQCRKDSCHYAMVLEEGDGPIFTCFLCGDQYCVRCNTDVHEGLSCEEYQRWKADNQAADQRFDEWRAANAHTCPGCGHAVQKKNPHECNKLTCSNQACKTELCNLCGKKTNGYDHFRDQSSPCYGKLWEGTYDQRQ